MPRLTKACPKYRHHRASGRAVVTIAGKDHYLGPRRSKASKAEYDRLIGEWLSAGRPLQRHAPDAEVTVAEVSLPTCSSPSVTIAKPADAPGRYPESGWRSAFSEECTVTRLRPSRSSRHTTILETRPAAVAASSFFQPGRSIVFPE